MVRRAKRYSALFSGDRERLVEALHRLHALMMTMQARLVPATPQYRALDRLSEAVIAAIREVSGRDPDWMEMQVHGVFDAAEASETDRDPEPSPAPDGDCPVTVD